VGVQSRWFCTPTYRPRPPAEGAAPRQPAGDGFFQAPQRFYENKTGMMDIPPGCPWDNGYV
jgi:hypothetical protein